MFKLSIITVCFNEKKNIEFTINSVINQTLGDFEYIIIDGGSTDGTLEIIEKYSDKIDIVVSENDSGIYNAMNKGIKIASGEYILFLNAGDYLLNNTVLEKVFQIDTNSDIIYGDGVLVYHDKLIRKPSSSKPSTFFMFFDTIPHQSSLIKKELFDIIGLYEESYKIAADYAFFLKAVFINKSKLKYIPLAFSVNNLLGLSNNRNYRSLMYKERKIAQDKYFNKKIKFLYIVLKPLFIYFFKYPRYIFYIFSSLLFGNFVGRFK